VLVLEVALIDLDRGPRRETGMSPYEVMLSESQERMLVVIERGHEPAVRELFAKWDLEAADIGEVTDEGLLVVLEGGVAVARLPVALLTGFGVAAPETGGLWKKGSS